MADVLTKEQRQRNMRNIKGKDTKPEILLRRALHARGLRYRLHCRKLPGSPDLVFPKYRAAIFVHGCFWHRHGCKYTSTPSTRTGFWEQKFLQNVRRDEKAVKELKQAGWRVGIVWECQLKKTHGNFSSLCDQIVLFLEGVIDLPDATTSNLSDACSA
ncbi:MAG: very short patch repair endonuclease [Desulfovibrio sp.]|jgi:DNA mismatch endonuclease (patch repair protein)|nr:very short patch repair endonuclease [Desulfovibrio sp.]